MKNLFIKNLLFILFIVLGICSTFAQQVPNASFEDWSGAKYDGQIQPKDWYASNVTQVGFNFNFAHQEAGHSGSYSMMVQDTEVGAMGITETSPGYFSLGHPWTHLPSITEVNKATAGTYGGINFKYRPDSMSVWIKRTGNNTDKEDFYLLYYAWSGTAKSSKYKGKNGSCTSVSQTNEESDIRLALNKNECGTDQKANQIAEGMWRERKTYGDWTNIRVPIYYFNNDVPTMMNIIFSASNYPNYRANSGLYVGNSLYVDDVELIYSSKIQKLYIDGKEWKGFDPYTSEEQTYSLGDKATTIPTVQAFRGAGELTNAKGETANFSGRELLGSEISITQGAIDGDPMVITVKAEDGKSTSTYKIKFVREASKNTKLANILVNGEVIANFKPGTYNYTVELPYGTKEAPVVSAEAQEDAQTIAISQPTSVTGSAKIVVTAADKKTQTTYSIQFKVALLADNTLQDIKVNGTSIPGFTPNQTLYRVSLPTSTNTIPQVEAVSAYATGEQTITHTAPTSAANLDGSQHIISVTTPGNSTPKTYKLTYKLEASSYAYLKDLQMGENLISNFDPEQFSYYVNLPIGTTQLPEIRYEKGESTQTVEIKEGGLNGVTKVIVTAGNKQNVAEYKINVATEQSEISSLNMIYVGGKAIDGFNANITTYTYLLPIGTTELPSITWDKGDEYQTVEMTTNGINGTTRITVTAGNGSKTIYQISFSVQKATDASLKMIYLDGEPLVGFDAKQLEYDCPLPQGTTTLPTITYEQANAYQTVTVRSGGINGDYRITVRPESGDAQTYILHFYVAKSNNVALQMIYLDGKPLDGFQPDSLNYQVTLPMGITTLPVISFDKGEASQNVLPMSNGTIRELKVTAESGKTQTYRIEFIIQRSTSAYLKMIYLDGDSLIGFEKEVYEYTYTLATNKCPSISVDKENDGQQVTISTPFSTGEVKVTVIAESGAANTYVIHITKPVDTDSSAALLRGIYIDGNAIADFAPNKFEYDIVYSVKAPTITYDADAAQKVDIFRHNNTITLYVVSGEERATYVLNLHPEANKDCTLRSLLANGSIVNGFDSSKKEYTITATSKEVVNFAYEKQYDEQTIYAGMQDANTYNVLVHAQSGDTTRYIVHIDRILNDDANLQNLQLKGMNLIFDPETYTYYIDLPYGYELPELIVEAKEDQSTATYIVSDTEQQVEVTAENGDKKVYRIVYNRTKSSDAYLSDILLNGTSLAGFDSNTFEYVDTLAWRTAIIPCVQAVGRNQEQTITTYHSGVNGVTKIHVLAANGVTSQEYSISFPIEKSSNVALKALEVEDAIGYVFDKNVTDYEILLPYGTKAVPQIFYEPTEPEQNICYIAAPIDKATKLIVTAENGDQRTYTLTFRVQLSNSENKLKSIQVNGEMLDIESSTELEVELPYATTEISVEYEKMFDEQTVAMVQQGINQPTKLIVHSNRGDELPTIYTITPKVIKYSPAVLTNILVNRDALSNFRPNQYSYVVNVEDKPEISYVANDSLTVEEVVSDDKHIVYRVTNGTYTNTYSIYYYYKNDVIPSNNFTETARTTYNGKAKPAGWMVPADCAESYTWTVLKVTTGQEVTPLGNNTVHLSTWRDGDANAIYGSIPGIMTTGTLSLTLNNRGNSTSSVSGGIPFRNTPDQIATDYRTTAYNNMDNWRLWVELGDGTTTRQTLYSGSHEPVGETWQSMTKDLDYSGLGVIKSMNITVNSAHSDNANDLGGVTKRTAEMDIRNLRFIYNSQLAEVTVNGEAATINGQQISYHINDAEYNQFPEIVLVGQKSDQMPVVDWQEEVDGLRVANIRNYGEDGSYTDYILSITRTLSTETRLQGISINNIPLSDFATETTDYVVMLPNGYTTLPSVTASPMGTHQQVEIIYSANTAQIVVTAETGDTQTYTIQFEEEKSNSTKLLMIVADGMSFAADIRQYEITANTMPEIRFTKVSDGQTVTLNKGVLTVEAEDGTIDTYTILLQKPIVTTTGQLYEIEINGSIPQNFSSSTYEYTMEKPQTVGFKRMNASDSVVFVETPQYMEWQVYGSTNNTYRITYPVELSANTDMENIVLNDVNLQDFDKQVHEYTYRTDNPVHVQAVANKKAQHMHMQSRISADTTIYSFTITAEDGTEGIPYIMTILPDYSSTTHLHSILLDGMPLSGFHADSLKYSIILPVEEYKTIEPTVPSIDYIQGAARQEVTIEYGQLGESTNIIVTSEDGENLAIYELYIAAEPSHCASLTGIAVNGMPVERFEEKRHYYSAKTTEEEVEITWSSNDQFQTITVIRPMAKDESYILRVVAQDGITTEEYTIDVYQEEIPNDIILANIHLNGKSFEEFDTILNPDLLFLPMQLQYNIKMPAGELFVIPTISTALNSEGQEVDIQIETQADIIKAYITVTAIDGVTKNTYTLNFLRSKMTNAELKMIYVDGEPLGDFQATKFNYIHTLPIGQKTMPMVYVEGYDGQLIQQDTISNSLMRFTVWAEDRTYQSSYTLQFVYQTSSNAYLQAIYADGVELEGFSEDVFIYADTLEIGTDHIPTITYEQGDDEQRVYLNKIVDTPTKQVTQIQVIAGDGNTQNLYTISYEIRLASYLQMIYVQGTALEGFEPTKNYYYLYMNAGDTSKPDITWDAGDQYQVISDTTQATTFGKEQIGWTSTIMAKIPNGESMTYTLQFYFTKALSTNSDVKNIYLNGSPLKGFAPDQHIYRDTVAEGMSMPNILVERADSMQTVDIKIINGNYEINVVAEDTAYQSTYRIYFEYLKSSYAYLEGIYQNGILIEGFRTDSFDYKITLPYGTTTLPEISYQLGKEGQVVDVDTVSGENKTTYIFTVIAPDEASATSYNVELNIALNNDSRLQTLLVKGVALDGFHTDSTEYILTYPIGSDTAALATPQDIVATPFDSNATVTINLNGTDIIIQVEAADGMNTTVYTIEQIILQSSNTRLSGLYIDSVMIRDFDPDKLEYSYYVTDGQPTIYAIAEDATSIVEYGFYTADAPYYIYVTAEDGSEAIYTIHFMQTTIQSSATPNTLDVLMKHINGSRDIAFATLRKNVSVAIYDINGLLLFQAAVPESNQNDAIIIQNAHGYEELVDVYTPKTIYTIPEDNKAYFYVFFENNTRRIASGKIVFAQ